MLTKIRSWINKKNTNLIVAGSALFISVCALLLSIQEVRIMRTQQKATMYPYLTVGKLYNSKGFGFVLKNSGNGLAKVNSYKVHNDSIHFRDWFDVLQNVMPEAQNINYGTIKTAGNIRKQMITPGETVNLIFFNWTPETRKLEKRLEDIQVEICYSSLLDEHWSIKNEIPIEQDDSCELELEKEFGF